MEPEIQGHKTKDMHDVDGYNSTPTINVKRLVLAMVVCGVILIGAVLMLP